MKKSLQVVFLLILTFFMFSAVNTTTGTDADFLEQTIGSVNDNKPQPDNNNTGGNQKQQAKRVNPDTQQNSGAQKDNHKSVNKSDPEKNQRLSRYFIDVSVAEQKVRIYDNGAIIKEWTVSTGKEGATPLGNFSIQNRGEWFFSEKYQQGAMWWVSFKDWGVYLFHSVPMDRNRNVLEEEAAKLGTPASHGCIRLEIDNARWIYDNIPAGTQVYIHE